MRAHVAEEYLLIFGGTMLIAGAVAIGVNLSLPKGPLLAVLGMLILTGVVLIVWAAVRITKKRPKGLPLGILKIVLIWLYALFAFTFGMTLIFSGDLGRGKRDPMPSGPQWEEHPMPMGF